MSLWLLLGAMTALATALVAWPLLRPPAAPSGRRDYELQVYRAQLEELAREQERGLLGEREAQAAKLEVERRMLAADAAASAACRRARPEDRALGDRGADRPAAAGGGPVLAVRPSGPALGAVRRPCRRAPAGPGGGRGAGPVGGEHDRAARTARRRAPGRPRGVAAARPGLRSRRPLRRCGARAPRGAGAGWQRCGQRRARRGARDGQWRRRHARRPRGVRARAGARCRRPARALLPWPRPAAGGRPAGRARCLGRPDRKLARRCALAAGAAAARHGARR